MKKALCKIFTGLALLIIASGALAQSLSNPGTVSLIEAKLLTDPLWLSEQAQKPFLTRSLAAGISASIFTLAKHLPDEVSKALLARPEIIVAEAIKKSVTANVTKFDVIGLALDVAAAAISQGITQVYGNDHPVKAGLYIAGVKGLTVLYAGLTKGLVGAIAKETILTAENFIDIYKTAKDLSEIQANVRETQRLNAELEEKLRAIKAGQYKENDNTSSGSKPKVIDTTTNYIAGSAVFSPSSGLAFLGTATGFEMRRDAPNTLESYDLGSSGSGSRGTASIADQGSDASAGNLNWGRWSGAGSKNIAGGTTYTGQNFHYVFGSAPTNYLNRTDSVTYTRVGGTNPTNSGGTILAAGASGGTFNSGTIGVNFATRAVTLSNLNFGFASATFNMNGSSTYNSNALFSGSLTGTCTGASCSGTVTGNHVGTLTGPAAAGIALGYQAHTNGTGMVVGAQGFKR